MKTISTEIKYFKTKLENIITKSILPTIRMHEVSSFNGYYEIVKTAEPTILKEIEISEKDFIFLKQNISSFEDDFYLTKKTIRKTENWERIYPYRKKYASRPESYMGWVHNTFEENETFFGKKDSKKIIFEEKYKDAYKKHVDIFIQTLERYMNDDKTHSIPHNFYEKIDYDYYVDLDFDNEEIVKIISDHFYISRNNNICKKNCDGRLATPNAIRIIKSKPTWLKRLYQIRENKCYTS